MHRRRQTRLNANAVTRTMRRAVVRAETRTMAEAICANRLASCIRRPLQRAGASCRAGNSPALHVNALSARNRRSALKLFQNVIKSVRREIGLQSATIAALQMRQIKSFKEIFKCIKQNKTTILDYIQKLVD